MSFDFRRSQKPLDPGWELIIDSEFARPLARSLLKDANLSRLPPNMQDATLCHNCVKLGDLDAFSVQWVASDNLSTNCDLHKFLSDICKDRKITSGTVKFERVHSTIKVDGRGSPVLTLFAHPDMRQATLQVGLPRLPDAGGPGHREIIKQWLQRCDEEHYGTGCGGADSGGSLEARALPTRVIDVDTGDDQVVRLLEPKPGEMGAYIALSHPWGTGPHFCTRPNNLEYHKTGIELRSLPKTFKDAVDVTRALGIKYLWIDSICIVQGPYGDFDTQARLMETVFSEAYCVVAASRSTGHDGGFLYKSRLDSPRLELQVGSRPTIRPPYYVCKPMDDFERHVLGGALHRRGWVFQEHALARRTLFFTDYQTYFECGAGVFCETMTHMRSNVAAYLGDPKFPAKALGASRGEKIQRFQELFTTYSALELTRETDRPVAIAGLLGRLVRTLGVAGDHGVLVDRGDAPKGRGLLRRSLLWRRQGDAMRRIPGLETTVPSWSWMAHAGAVGFLSPEYRNTQWAELLCPWTDPGAPLMVGVPALVRARCAPGVGLEFLVARGHRTTRKLVDGEASFGSVFFDDPSKKTPGVLAVVLGMESSGARMHFVLLVKATNKTESGLRVFERVGAGRLVPDCIDMSNGGEVVVIS